jgi:hypothetical protein
MRGTVLGLISMTPLPLPPRSRPIIAALALTLAVAVQAQQLNATGVVGGLSIPNAQALGSGTLALGLGNPLEPQSVARSARSVTHVLGIGLAPGLDLVGRFAEYSTRQADGFLVGGRSDLSANVKFSLAPWPGIEAPRLAFGVNDIAGGATMFRATYAVATQPWGPWSVTLGAGRSPERPLPGTRQPLDGVFGGIDYRLKAAGLAGTVHFSAEHDARQALAGARWVSPALAPLGGARLSASVHRSFEHGAMPGSTAFGFYLSKAFGDEAAPPADAAPTSSTTNPPLPEAAVESAMARLGRLRAALVAAGLEKVRVGRAEGHWIIQYQNHRYGRHELDAIGLVLGLAAEAAPPEVERLVVSTLKTGQPVQTLSVSVVAWRDFVRDGRAGALRESMRVQRGAAPELARVDWMSDAPSPASLAQLRLSPQLAYAMGTEFGAFDYSLALRLSATVPLWAGAQVVAQTQQRVAISDQADEGGVFASLRQRQGLQALAVHQTLWLGPHAVVGGAAGVFEYDAPGVEGEALVFVPGRDDVVRLRGRQLERRVGMPAGGQMQQWFSYRWVPRFGGWMRDTWIEVGAQRYSDRSRGPMLTVSRWWGDFGAHLVYRKGGVRQFAGLEISLPLTPRAAPAIGPVQLLGASQWRTGLRTRLTDANAQGNWVEPGAVRDFAAAWDLEQGSLDAGRHGAGYVRDHLDRLRDAYLSMHPERAWKFPKP